MESENRFTYTELKSRFIRNNWSCSRLKIMFFWRLLAVLSTMVAGAVNSVTGWAVQKKEVPCISDMLFSPTASANQYFQDHPENRNTYLIVASLLSDFLFVCFVVRFIFWGNSTRPLIFFTMFYTLSCLVQGIFRIESSSEYCWEYPEFPSLILTYGSAPGFYYSTIPGVLLFFCLENWEIGNYFLMGLSIMTCAYVSVLTLIMRSQYTTGIITSLAMAHYFWMVSEKLSKKLDFLLGNEQNKQSHD